MSSCRRKFVALALLAGLAVPLFAQSKAARKRRRQPKPAAMREQTQPAPAATPPPAPLRPEQMPPSPPLVTYRDGQLTISADNSTLSSILSAVRARTGASLDIPPDAARDRVAVRLGPGDPRDVLSELLQGSRFNYILLGSEDNPDGLSQIILTPRSGAAGAAPAVAAGAPSPPSEEDDTGEAEPQPAPQFPMQRPPAAQPEIAPTPPEAQQQPQGEPQVKTPEQLLQELQRMRQQQMQPNRPAPGRPQPPQRQPPP